MKAPKQSRHRGNNNNHQQPFIQRKAGGQGVGKGNVPFISGERVPGVQAKLKIGQSGDRYEQEADRMAERVMRMPVAGSATPMISRMHSSGLGVQRMCSSCQEELQRMPMEDIGNDESFASAELENRLQSRQGQGAPLPPDVLMDMEEVFGEDFSGVRVHTDSEAVRMTREINARAFTRGADIYFNQGEFDLGSASGRGLLGHELAHVVQQGTQVKNNGNLLLQTRRLTEQRGSIGLSWYLEATPLSPIISQGTEVTFRLRNSGIPSDTYRRRLVNQVSNGQEVSNSVGETSISQYSRVQFGVIDERGEDYPWHPPIASTNTYPLNYIHTFNQEGPRTVYFSGIPTPNYPTSGRREQLYVSYDFRVIGNRYQDIMTDPLLRESDEDLLRDRDTTYGELAIFFQREAISQALQILSENEEEAIQLAHEYPLPAHQNSRVRATTALDLFNIYNALNIQLELIQSQIRNYGHQSIESDQNRSSSIMLRLMSRSRQIDERMQGISADYPEVAAAYRHRRSHPTMGMNFNQIVGNAIRQIQIDIHSTRRRLITGEIPILSVRSITAPLLQQWRSSNSNIDVSFQLIRQENEENDLLREISVGGIQIALLFIPGIGPTLSAGFGLITGGYQTINSWSEAIRYAAGANTGLDRGIYTIDEAEQRRSQAILDSIFTIVDVADMGVDVVNVIRRTHARHIGVRLNQLDSVLADTTSAIEIVDGVNIETRALLEINPLMRETIELYPLAARAFKFCNSPCLPPMPPATVDDYARFQRLIVRMDEADISFSRLDPLLTDNTQVARFLHDQAAAGRLTSTIENFENNLNDIRSQVIWEELGSELRTRGRRGPSTPITPSPTRNSPSQIVVSQQQYLMILQRHPFLFHHLDEISGAIDIIATSGANLALSNRFRFHQQFVNALTSGDWTQAGTYFHIAVSEAGDLLNASNLLPSGFNFEFTILSGRGGSRADVFIQTPSGQMFEIDWKTTGRSALRSRSQMDRHARQIRRRFGVSLTGQASRSWVDYVRGHPSLRVHTINWP